MRVNNKEIVVYQLDTIESISIYIASIMNTLSKYLYYPAGTLNLTESKNINAEDGLELIRKYTGDNISFKEFFHAYRNQFSESISDVELAKTWLAFNTYTVKQNIHLSEDMILSIMMQPAEEMIDFKIFKNVNEFTSFWKNRESFKKDVEIKIRQNKGTAERLRKLYSQFDVNEEKLIYTDFRVKQSDIDLILKLTDITILELFNNIVLNDNAPYAVCKNYYKILKDYLPSEEWRAKDIETDTIEIKINDKEVVYMSEYKDYISVSISGNSPTIIATMKINTDKGFVSQQKFIERFFNLFPRMENIQYNQQTKRMVGLFFFPIERLDSYVFSDLVMNDEVFSTLINIDESNKPTKKKSELGQPWLHLNFDHPSTGHITASITQKNVERSDSETRQENRTYGEEIFELGEPFIRVKVHGKDVESINRFQELFSRLLVLYKERYSQIVQEYKKFIPDFGIVREYVPTTKKKQTDFAPEIFVSTYTRFCGKDRVPTIVDDEEAKDYEEKGQQVMKFPRDKPKTGIVYPSDGVKQMNFVCLNSEYKYPGLQINKREENKAEYPFIPCCFKTDQDKAGGIYRQYYHGEESASKETKKQQDIISTGKILTSVQHGHLSVAIKDFFSGIESDTNYEYLRYGVEKTPSSLLNVVMIALHEQTNIFQLDKEELLNRLVEIRTELGEIANASTARQSCYNLSIDTVMNNIKNPETYLDPKLYTQLLENYFNCTIFLFNTERLITPRYTQGYYQNKFDDDTPCIFVYEHMGSESDQSTYPQCELIIRWKIGDKEATEYSFPSSHRISKIIRQVFELTTESYALNKEIRYIDFPISQSDEIELVAQNIDDYGKTRCIHVKVNDEPAVILTTPIPPLILPETDESVVMTTVANAQKILETFGTVKSKTFTNDAINGIIGNVFITIPVSDGSEIELPRARGLYYVNKADSILDLFNKNKKLARYITEYIFWLFSVYIHKKGVDYITDKVLADFAKNEIVIDKNFTYKNVAKTFSYQSGVMKNNKLVVADTDMLKRLMYVLKLYSIQDIHTLRNYRTYKVIQQYYVDITDFDYQSNQVILQGEDSLEKWIRESKTTHILQKSIVLGYDRPYFFLNENISADMYLAQNVSSVDAGIYTAINWNRRGYNVIEENVPEQKYQFTLYTYVNENDIGKVIVNGMKPNKEIRILGYKLDNNDYFTVLLDLEN